MAPKEPSFRNHLLQSLAADDLALLAPELEALQFPERQEWEKPNKPIGHVYFPESGIGSVVARGPRQKPVEIGLIGREGMSGLAVLMGSNRTPHATYVQIPGHGHRIAADAFRQALKASPGLRDRLLCYVQAFMVQTAYTAISNASGKLEERLARWLLMAHDRIDGDELPLVHEFLALMLAVRRAGVTVALHRLEQSGLIEAARRRLIVLDRDGLMALANSSYGVPEGEYHRLMKRPRGA